MKNRGFTFIEILVSMTIMGIILAIGLSKYGDTQKKARDTKRQADLKQIQAALEMCKTDSGNYPTGDIITAGTIVCGTETYMATIPTDPKSDRSYTYVYGSYSYSLCASKELPANPTSYCVTNP